jgi:hypothetical protein
MALVKACPCGSRNPPPSERCGVCGADLTGVPAEDDSLHQGSADVHISDTPPIETPNEFSDIPPIETPNEFSDIPPIETPNKFSDIPFIEIPLEIPLESIEPLDPFRGPEHGGAAGASGSPGPSGQPGSAVAPETAPSSGDSAPSEAAPAPADADDPGPAPPAEPPSGPAAPDGASGATAGPAPPGGAEAPLLPEPPSPDTPVKVCSRGHVNPSDAILCLAEGCAEDIMLAPVLGFAEAKGREAAGSRGQPPPGGAALGGAASGGREAVPEIICPDDDDDHLVMRTENGGQFAVRDGDEVGRLAKGAEFLEGYPTVSRRHVSVARRGGSWFLRNLSHNGTYVDGVFADYLAELEVSPGAEVLLSSKCRLTVEP